MHPQCIDGANAWRPYWIKNGGHVGSKMAAICDPIWRPIFTDGQFSKPDRCSEQS